MLRSGVVYLVAAATAVLCLQLVTPGAGEDNNCSETGAKARTLQERRLLNCLLHFEYDPAVRPATDPGAPVDVIVDSIDATVIDLDEKTGVLTTELWLLQTWTDPQLSWNPDNFDGLTEIRLPIEYIWTPSIVLHNNADDSFEYKMDKLAIVNSSGVVLWTPHGRLRSYCNPDWSSFPFDTQDCFLTFGPWTYDRTLVNVSLNPTSENHHRKFVEKRNTEWTTIGYSVHIVEHVVWLHGLLDMKQYQVVIFAFTIERSSTFFKYVFIAPSVLLVILTLCLYWIPIQSGERFTLASGVFVSVMLMVLLLEGYLPSNIGRLPVVASYVAYNLVLAVLTVIVSLVVVSCHHRDAKTAAVPRLIRSIFLGRLGRLCCVSALPYSPVVTEDKEDHGSRRPVRRRQELFDLEQDPSAAADADRRQPSATPSSTLEQTLADIRDYLRHLAAAAGADGDVDSRQGSAPSHRDLVVGEWQRVALVIDRVSFALFSFISIVVTIALYRH